MYLKEQHVTFHWLLRTVGQSMIEDPRAALFAAKNLEPPNDLISYSQLLLYKYCDTIYNNSPFLDHTSIVCL